MDTMKKLMQARSRWDQLADKPPLFTDFIDKNGAYDHPAFQKATANWRKALKSAKDGYDQAFLEHQQGRHAGTRKDL